MSYRFDCSIIVQVSIYQVLTEKLSHFEIDLLLKNFYSGTMKPMHPKILHGLIVKNNAAIFNAFIEFPKPVSLNGHTYF